MKTGTKLVWQIIAALLMTSWGGIYLTNLGNLFGTGDVLLWNWAIPFTVFSVIGVMNALNMADGVDGLAGGLSIAAIFWFGIAIVLSGDTDQVIVWALLGSVVLGFLCFNMRSPWRPCAAVFMGDAGSLFLGLGLAWLAVDLTTGSTHSVTPITAVWALAIPLMDTVSTMIRRMIKGRNPFSADGEHLHHIFLAAGFSVNQTVSIILIAAFAVGGVGVAGWYYQVPEYVMFYVFAALFVTHCAAVSYSWRVMRVMRAVRIAVFGERQCHKAAVEIRQQPEGDYQSAVSTDECINSGTCQEEQDSPEIARQNWRLSAASALRKQAAVAEKDRDRVA